MTDILDDIIPGAPADANDTDNTENTNDSEWPKLITNLPAGERPEGSVSVPEFTRELIRRRVEELLDPEGPNLSAGDAAVQATTEISQPQVYQAVNSARHPAPHYVVRTETDVEVKDDNGETKLDAEGNPVTTTKVTETRFLPLDLALEWWANRPARGSGGTGAARSADDVDKRLRRAAAKFNQLEKAKERQERINAQVATLQAQWDRYVELMAEDGKTPEDAQAIAEELAEKAEEAKAIPDDGEE